MKSKQIGGACLPKNTFLPIIIYSVILLVFIFGGLAIIYFVPKVSHYTIVQTYRLNNNTDSSKGLFILPGNQQNQTIKDIKMHFSKEEPLEYISEENGEYYSLRFENKSNYLVMLPLKIEYQVTFSETSVRQKREPNYRYYLGPELGMETNHPFLISTARQLAPKEINENEKIQAIGEFTENTIKLAGKSTKSALETLNTKSGDGRDKALLFAALCRTRGLPSRLKKGMAIDLIFPGQKISADVDNISIKYWSEYYNEENGWLYAREKSYSFADKLNRPTLDFGEYNLNLGEQALLPFDSIEISLNWFNHATYILILLFTLIIAGLLFRKFYRDRQIP